MSNIELRFDQPWLLLLAVPAIVLILLPYFRLPSRRRRTAQRIVPVILHSLMALLLTLLLAGTAIVRNTDNQAVVLVVDCSDSTLPVRDAIRAQADTLQKLIAKHTPVSLVAFGGDQTLAVTDLSDPVTTPADATDLASALEYAASILPPDRAGRIILLSDGRQTDGDADAIAQYLHSQGVRIDAMWFDSTLTGNEIQISGFTAPQTAFTGKTVTFTAELESSVATPAVISLYEGDTLISSQEMTVPTGTSVLTFEAPAQAPGLHSYRLELEPTYDTLPENNRALACVEVVSAPSVLILSGLTADPAPLKAALEGSAQVTAVSAPKAPRKLTELCDYDGIILLNVHADDLPKKYAELLNTYVSVHGRSLLAVGGPDTLMYGSMRDTVFEEMMPVSFSLSRTSEDDSVALMLVMDCSLSMSQQSAFMSVAKQGSIKCVEAMTENDYVGIISFNQTAVVEAPLAKNTIDRKAALNRIISGLTTSQGTYYTDALALAHQELLKSDAPVRHILFVSDGGPADTTYTELLPDIVADGITISTIGLGYSSSLLSDMAENCGGTYYFVKESTDLPDIMLSLTQQISVNSLMTGNFTPTGTATLTEGLSAPLPALTGYLGTTAKRGTEPLLTVGEGHPLYVAWPWGEGTAAVFTGDLSPAWSAQWLETDTGRELIRRILDHAMPDVHRDSSLMLTAEPGSLSAELTVQTADTDQSVLTLTQGDTSLEMTRRAPGVYTARMRAEGMGAYPITVTQTDRKGNPVDSLTLTVTIPTRAEYDAFSDDGQTLLESLCLHSGGLVTDDAQALADASSGSISVVSDFRVPLGILLAVLMLADVAVRKLRWKDIRNLFLKRKHAK